MKRYALILLFSVLYLIAARDLHAQTTRDACLNQTRQDGECKDCCDTLDGDAATRKSCRDECATHDFTQNSDFITINAPSTLGENGDYSACASLADEPACKECCDGSSDVQSGDRRFCRDACNAKFGGASKQADGNQQNQSKGQPKAKQQQGNSQQKGGKPQQKGGNSQNRRNENQPQDRQNGERQGEEGRRTPPQEAIDACNGKSDGAACEFTSPRGDNVSGVCETRDNLTACKPNNRPDDRQPGENSQDQSRKPGGKNGQQPQNGQGGGYSVEQAISDRAQLTTIAFAGLAYLTGDLCGDTFLPPGKVSDFFGFQYLRDTDSGELGHNTTFVPRSANGLLSILTDAQKAQLIALAKEQVAQINDFGYQRFPLMKAFRRQLEGDIPAGSNGLNKEAVMTYSADLYELDGQLSYQRAQVLGGIIRSLDAQQRAFLDKMAAGNSLSWPDLPDQVDKRSYSPAEHVAIMTYASEMFSWYAGSVEADTYFCPERHGMYFGAFYMKDIPAMGNPDYSIGTQITGDQGDAFLSVLTDAQRQQVTSLVDLQRADLEKIVETRRAISTQLRRFMKEKTVDEAAILALSEEYGRADGELSYLYATHFAEVAKTLSSTQKAELMKLRNLEGFACKGAYLYSQNVAMPNIPNTDFLFQ